MPLADVQPKAFRARAFRIEKVVHPWLSAALGSASNRDPLWLSVYIGTLGG